MPTLTVPYKVTFLLPGVRDPIHLIPSGASGNGGPAIVVRVTFA
jgi:hypothetical protein